MNCLSSLKNFCTKIKYKLIKLKESKREQHQFYKPNTIFLS